MEERIEDKAEEKRMLSSRIGSSLLKRKMSGELTQEQFEKEIAYWTMVDAFEALKYCPLPIPPEKMIEYWNMTDEVRGYNQDIFKREDVRTYLEMKGDAELTNKTRYDMLNELMKTIPEEDITNREKITVKINEFRIRFENDGIKA